MNGQYTRLNVLNLLTQAINVDVRNVNQLREILKLYRLDEIKKNRLQEGEFKGCYDYQRQDVVVCEILESFNNPKLNKLIETFKKDNWMETNAEAYLSLFYSIQYFVDNVLMISGNTHGPYIEVFGHNVTFVKNSNANDSRLYGTCICF